MSELLKTLTQRQEEVLTIIKNALARGEPSPSLREIADHLGVKHKSGISGHLRALERKGYITRSEQRVSEFNLLTKSADAFALVGMIAAGVPRSSYDQYDQEISFTPSYFGGGDLAAVTICGDSMAGDAICDGDIAIIKMQKEAGPQDIVALRIDQDEVTLKRIRRHASILELLSSNPAFPIRRVPAEQAEILGKLVGLVRTLKSARTAPLQGRKQ